MTHVFQKGNEEEEEEEEEEAGSDRERDRVIAVRFTSTPQLGSFMSAPLIATINVTTKCLLFDRFASVRSSYLSSRNGRSIDRSRWK